MSVLNPGCKFCGMPPNDGEPCGCGVAASPNILHEAAAIVDGPRRDDYGTPAENHNRTASLWSAYLQGRTFLTARDVCMLNILQKVSRDRYAPKRDNLVDIAGYARNAELCEEAERPPSKAAEHPEACNCPYCR